MPYEEQPRPQRPSALELAQAWDRHDFTYPNNIDPYEKRPETSGGIPITFRYGQLPEPGCLFDFKTCRIVFPIRSTKVEKPQRKLSRFQMKAMAFQESQHTHAMPSTPGSGA